MTITGLSWDKIWRMINEAKQINDPYANMIQSIDYKNKSLKILLNFGENEEPIPIDVDIRFTA
jgi:hypothetical protein